jgi:hypothetical protein
MRFGLRRQRGKEAHGKMDKGYVSEFGSFITHFLEEHPEELEERDKGRALYWDHKADMEAPDKAARDDVPDDRYGFDYSAWRVAKKEGSSGNSR